MLSTFLHSIPDPLTVRFGPERALFFATRAAVLTGFSASCLSSLCSDQPVIFDIIWFFLAFAAFAHYVCRLVHTLESVREEWVACVGLGLFGIQESLAEMLSVILALVAKSWTWRFFWTTLALYCIFILLDIFPLRRRSYVVEQREESFATLLQNSLGVRYLACLSVIWLCHGYVGYANSHEIYMEDVWTQTYCCLTDAISKLLVLGICAWTGQKRAVMATVLFLLSTSCFALFTWEESEFVVDMFDQVWFLE